MIKPQWQDRLLLFAAPAAFLALLEGFSHTWTGQSWGVVSPGAYLLTLALWLGLCMALSIFRSLRIRWALTALVGLVASLIGIANRYKMRYRMEPALFSDLYQLGDAVQAAQNMSFSIDPVEIAAVCAAFAVLLLPGLRVRSRMPKRRIALPAVGLALLVAVPPLCTFERFTSATRYDLVDCARTDGTLYTALAVENHRRELMRMDYREQDVRAQYQSLMADTPAASAETPNILLVLSESFTDEAWFSEYVDFTREIMPFYNGLIQTCQHGRISVPKVGGGTSETEFEVLTGLRSQYAINPYAMGLPPMNSLASVLRDRGLRASAIHWQTGVYYNRYHNLRRLGFQEFYTTDTTQADFTKKGQYVSDAAHYRAALAQMERTPERDFVFVITMQNHGGYAYADFRELYGADTPFANPLDEESEKVLANFCWMLGESDRALEELITSLQAFDEPTLVVVYGDHIAPFGEEVYAGLGVDLTAPKARQTPYFIWSNANNTLVEKDLYAWQLGAEALDVSGMGDDPFLHYVASLDTADDPTHALLSYDALFGQQYAYAEGGLKPESEKLHIGGEMKLLGMEALQIGQQIFFHPVMEVGHQKYELLLNGQSVQSGCIPADAGHLEISAVMKGLRNAEWNRANTLYYASAQEMLAQSQPWAYETLPLVGWERMSQSEAHTVWKSLQTVRPTAPTALLCGGEAIERCTAQTFQQAGQYFVDAAGHVCIALAGDQEPAGAQLLLFAE